MGSIEHGKTQIAVNLSKSLPAIPPIGSAEYLVLPSTDHMITVAWTSAYGWETPKLILFDDLRISPTASCLHYATECFEGMKAYRGHDGLLRLFRPDCNGERLAMSSERASLPTYPAGRLTDLIAKLIELDGDRWLPKDKPGHFLYIRPAVIGTGSKLGYKIPSEALLFIVATPYRDLSMSPEGKPNSLKLLASPPGAARSWPGGFGYAKLGANYCPSLLEHQRASAAGFDQVLWLYGSGRQITEAGASNIFFIWKKKGTETLELVTPCLQNSLILSGITRRSLLELARSRLSDKVGDLEAVTTVERDVSISDVELAAKEGRLLEAFVTGTAYFVTSVGFIQSDHSGIDIPVPDIGGYAAQMRLWLDSITYGKEDHPWAFTIGKV